MASGVEARAEAGGVGGEYEVASSNQLTGETGRVAAGGEIEVASLGNQVAEGTERVGGLFRVSPTNKVTGEAGTVGGEIWAGHVEQVIQEGGVGGEIGVVSAIHVSGVGGLDDEIGVASANQITGGPGGVGGEIGVASVDQIIQETVGVADEIGVAYVNQIIQEPEGLGGEIRVGSADHVKGEAGALEGEIRTTSVNHMIKEAGASGGEIRAVSVNHVTEEAEATGGEIEVVSDDQVNGEPARVDGEVEVASADKVNERGVESVKIEMASVNIVSEPGGESGKIESASVNDVNGESGCGGGEVEVASAIQVNGKPGSQIGGIGIASSNKVNGEPGGTCGESGVAFANQVNVEPVGAGGESGVASGNQISGQLGGDDNKFGVSSVNQMNGQLGGDENKFGVSSANQLNGEPGCSSGEIRVASAGQVNEEPGGDIGFASANQMNGEPGGNIGLASTNQVNRESGEEACEIQVTSANQVNGVSGRVGVEFGLREKHRWVETKVYRRRPKGEKNKGFLSDLTAALATKTLICNRNGSETNKIVEVNTHKSNKNHNNDHVDGKEVVESEKIVCVPSSCDNANLKQIRPKTVGEVILNKELSSAGMDGATLIPVDQPITNGALRPPNSANDRKVKINLASTGKLELRELKRKFEGELYSVRKAVKKMDVGAEEVVHEFFHAVVNSSVVPNGSRSNGFATRVYSGTRSLGHVPWTPNIRPFNQLRVSVAENGHSMVDSIEREKRTPKANQFYRNSEFLLANDKFPPAESNKKSKSNGKKSSGSEFGFGVGSKVYKSCCTLLEKLMKHKHGWVFNAPVDVKALGLHDYFLIIKNPMDLGTVKTKLIKYWYKSPMEFAEDVRLTFHNAMLYNPKGHDVHIMAETLLKIFEGKWPDIEVKYLRELRMAVEPDMGYPTPTSRITNPFQSSAFPPLETRVFNRSESMPHPVNPKPRTLTPAASFRTPALKKPKAKDVNKRDMTYDEKQKLSTNLQSLPPEKLDGVIQIIKKRSTALSQNDDEIEVDIDSVDTETLWELDRFVSNYKKSLSKNRRKAELANQMRAEARQAAEKITTPQPLPQKESTSGYGNATSSLPPHHADPAANASGSSSSSSSSGSGSSSSDSDSDSSSEESDGGHSPGT